MSIGDDKALIKRNIYSVVSRISVIFLLMGIACLIGCVRKEGAWTPVANPEISWSNHQKLLSDIQSFKLEGKAGFSEGKTGQTIHFMWVQADGDYTLDFYGPLNVKVATLVKNQTGITLLTSKGKLVSDDPESLMQQELGFSLPIEGLQFWILGLPQDQTSEKKINAYGYLKSLREDGWSIEYLQYESFHDLGWPSLMTLKQGPYRVVLSVQHMEN